MYKHIFSRSLLMVACVFTVISCVKEDNKIGENIIGGFESVTKFTDTVEISTKVLRVDSMESYNLNFSVLGAVNDEKFGKTDAKLFSQIFLEQNNLDFGVGSTLDSLVLILPYAGFYGDTNTIQEWDVFEVTEDIDTLKKFSNQAYSYNATPITPNGNSFSFNPNPRITNSEGNKTYTNLRIPIDINTFGKKIFDKSGMDELKDDDNFKQFVKGIFIAPKNNHPTNEGAIFVFEYSKIKMQMYFHDNANVQDSINFVFTTTSNHLNTYDHYNYSNSEALNSIDVTNSEKLYIQSQVGLQVEIDFPNIANLKDSLGGESFALNKAVLQIHHTGDTVPYFSTPSLLGLNEYRANDKDELKYFELLDGSSVGGGYDKDEKNYNFSITRYLSDRINGKSDEKLYLRRNSYASLQRTILHGVNSTDDTKKMKLSLIYTVDKN